MKNICSMTSAQCNLSQQSDCGGPILEMEEEVKPIWKIIKLKEKNPNGTWETVWEKVQGSMMGLYIQAENHKHIKHLLLYENTSIWSIWEFSSL